MPTFWTPLMEQRFHRAVAALQRVAKDSSDEIVYGDPQLRDDQTGGYSLKFKHELQIANHMAYLAHSEEGVEAISAACVEEHDGGLVLRLASNHSPTASTVAGLRALLDIISAGVAQGGLATLLDLSWCLSCCVPRTVSSCSPGTAV